MVELPYKALGDAQIAAEYVAYNIPILAAQSATKQISIIGHSQGGGINPQCLCRLRADYVVLTTGVTAGALDFWPSTRQYVSNYVALAGDFHGTIIAGPACLENDILNLGCPLSLLQQVPGSKLLDALNRRGGEALVTTTSIYSQDDEIVPQDPLNPTSYLPGAVNIKLQNDSVCGPLHVVEHLTILIDPAAYFLAYDALIHKGGADIARFDHKYCTQFVNQTAMNPKYLSEVTKGITAGLARAFTPAYDGPRDFEEPQLKKYVCDQGQAENCGSE